MHKAGQHASDVWELCVCGWVGIHKYIYVCVYINTHYMYRASQHASDVWEVVRLRRGQEHGVR